MTAADLFRATQAGSHEARVRLTTYTPAGGVRDVHEGLALSGSVTYDRQRDVRRSVTLTVVDPDGTLSPRASTDEFAPGAAFSIDRGVYTAGGWTYWPLGRYIVVDFKADAYRGTLTLRGEDPSSIMAVAFGEAKTIASGARARDVLRTLWEPALGDGSAWLLDDGGAVVGSVRNFQEDDEWLHGSLMLMADLGIEVWMDRAGTPVMRPYADPTTLPVVSVIQQAAGVSTALKVVRSGDWRPVNRQPVVGEPESGAAVRGVATITDTSNPYHENYIGPRSGATYRTSQVADVYSARVLAERILIDRSTWRDEVTVEAIPDFTLDAGEVIRVIESRSGTDAAYVIDVLTLPVAQGAMTIEGTRVVPVFAPEAL